MRLSMTCCRVSPDSFWSNAPACSKSVFLSPAGTSSATWDALRRAEIRFIASMGGQPFGPSPEARARHRRSFYSAVAPCAALTVQSHFFLVLDDQAVELVHQAVDGGVHVFIGALAEDVAARHVYVGFDFLLQL